MAIPETTFNHNFGQTVASNGPNAIAVTLGAAEVLTLTNAGGRVIAINASGAGASVGLPDPAECIGQTRTLINTGTNNLNVTRTEPGPPPVVTFTTTLSSAPADRSVAAAIKASNVVILASNGTTWSRISAGNAPTDANA